jgi:transcriptional regulator with XRE-family HTH domain
MPHPEATAPEAPDLCIGTRLREFRMAQGLSLANLSRLTGISDATLSRVENAQTLVSAHNLYILSKALKVDITAFYEPAASPIRTGIRSVSRAGAGRQIDTARFSATVFGADLANKKMHPALDLVSATTLEQVGGLAGHSGEEFLLVLEGALVLHSAHYAPLRLNTGDSIYFDAGMPHAYLAADDTAARILVVNSSEPDLGDDRPDPT